MKFISIIKYRPGDAVKSWDEVYVGMKVYYWGDRNKILAEVKEVNTTGATIEFSKKPNGLDVHSCWGKIPSGRGYLVGFSDLLLKAEETY